MTTRKSLEVKRHTTWCTSPYAWSRSVKLVSDRGLGNCIYIALSIVPEYLITRKALRHGSHSVTYLQLHQCLPLPRKRSPDGTSPVWGCGRLIAANYSFIYSERGRFTHISGHPSATGRAQDRESAPVKLKDQRSTTVPRNQPVRRRSVLKYGKR